MRAGADGQSDRQGTHQRGHGGHHDRAEADQAGFVDRLFGGFCVLALCRVSALRFNGEVDHHDGILLDNADQHDQADEAIQIQIHLEQHQREQCAEAGAGQSGQYGDRVQIAFVEDAQDQINHEDRHHQQQTHAGEGGLKGLRRTLEVADECGRNAQLRKQLFHLSDGL